MSTHNICFRQKIRKNIDTFWLKKAHYQELCYNELSLIKRFQCKYGIYCSCLHIVIQRTIFSLNIRTS